MPRRQWPEDILIANTRALQRALVQSGMRVTAGVIEAGQSPAGLDNLLTKQGDLVDKVDALIDEVQRKEAKILRKRRQRDEDEVIKNNMRRRIAELEGAVQARDDRIAELEDSVQARDDQIALHLMTYSQDDDNNVT